MRSSRRRSAATNGVWTLELRHDIVFQDGTPLNAEAVKYTIERMKDAKRAAPQAVLFAPVNAVRVTGEYTVELETQAPLRLPAEQPGASERRHRQPHGGPQAGE